MTDSAILSSRGTLKTWLLNPFHFVAGGQALGIGLAIVVVASVNGSVSNSHFDGVFDFHMGARAALWVFVAEGLVDWVVISLFLWAAGLLISKSRVRAIDVFGTQALARVPTLVTVGVVLLPGFQRQLARLMAVNQEVVPRDIAEFAVAAFVTIVMLIWMVALMYRAFAVSCNVKGGKAIGAFVIAGLLSEILSKVVLILMLKHVLG